jgi:long-chain acyl-CoA synthetase
MKNKAYPLYPVPDFKTIKELILTNAEKHPNNPAFAYQQGETVHHITYEKFASDVNSLGTHFYDLGLTDGAKIAVMGENSYLWLVTYMAAVCGGNVIVPLDKELNEEEIRHILVSSGATTVVYSDSYVNMFDTLKKIKKLPTKLFLNIRHDIPLAISKGKDLIDGGHYDYLNHEIDPIKTCAIIYTSGTTDLAKGVMLSHRSLVATVTRGNRLALINGPTVLLLPLHHTYAMAASVLTPLLHGQMIFINDGIKNVLRDIKTTKPQFLCVVPLYVESFCKKIWENIRKQGKEDLVRKIIKLSNGFLKVGIDLRRVLFKSVLNAFGGKLEILVSGGAPLDVKYYEDFNNFGIHLIEGYGITECSPIVSLNRNHHWKIGSVGLVVPGCEVQIFSDEICVRGDIVMNGYYNNLEATIDAMRDGWFHTGDLGYIDDEGFIFITGRKKNLIIRSNGKNVHPEELEEKFRHIPEIGEIVVHGDKRHLIAEIYINPEIENTRATEKTIIKQIKEINKTLPIYKRPNKIRFRDTEFEKTTTKKIKRRGFDHQCNSDSSEIEI